MAATSKSIEDFRRLTFDQDSVAHYFRTRGRYVDPPHEVSHFSKPHLIPIKDFEETNFGGIPGKCSYWTIPISIRFLGPRYHHRCRTFRVGNQPNQIAIIQTQIDVGWDWTGSTQNHWPQYKHLEEQPVDPLKPFFRLKIAPRQEGIPQMPRGLSKPVKLGSDVLHWLASLRQK